MKYQDIADEAESLYRILSEKTVSRGIDYPAYVRHKKMQQHAHISAATAERERNFRFNEWCSRERWSFNDANVWVALHSRECYTTSELHEIFLNEK